MAHKILVVDDAMFMRTMIKNLLKVILNSSNRRSGKWSRGNSKV